MSPERRSFLAALGAGTVMSTAGCLGIGDFGDEEPPEVPESENDENEDENDDEDNEIEIEELVHETTTELLEKLSWIANEYSDTVQEYIIAGETVHELVEDLQETLEQGGTVSEAELDELYETVDEELSRLGPRLFGDHFDGHRNFVRRFEEQEEDLRDYAALNETNRALEIINEFNDELSREFDRRYVELRYPTNPITRKAYTWFVNTPEDTHRLFEVQMREVGRFDDLNEFRTHALPHAGTQTSHDGFNVEPETSRNRPVAFHSDLDNTVLEYISVYSDSEKRERDLVVRTSYVTQEESRNDRVDIDLQELSKSAVYVQQYESEDAAIEAYNRVIDNATEYDTVTQFGMEFEQIYVDYEGQNMYADAIQFEDIVIHLNITPVPWRSREPITVDEDVNENEEAEQLFLYDDSFLDQTEQYEELTRDEDESE